MLYTVILIKHNNNYSNKYKCLYSLQFTNNQFKANKCTHTITSNLLVITIFPYRSNDRRNSQLILRNIQLTRRCEQTNDPHSFDRGENWTDKCSSSTTKSRRILQQLALKIRLLPILSVRPSALCIIRNSHNRRRPLCGGNSSSVLRYGGNRETASEAANHLVLGEHIASNETISEKSKQIIYHAAFLKQYIQPPCSVQDGYSIRKYRD